MKNAECINRDGILIVWNGVNTISAKYTLTDGRGNVINNRLKVPFQTFIELTEQDTKLKINENGSALRVIHIDYMYLDDDGNKEHENGQIKFKVYG